MANKTIIVTALMLLGFSLIYPGSQSGQENRRLTFDIPDNFYGNRLFARLNDSTLNPDAFHMAYMGYRALVANGTASKKSVITVIDYTRPSTEKRLFVIDPLMQCIRYRSLVAHGRNSGELYARSFSNRLQSHQTALGFYVTGHPYLGSQGYSLLINGVDTGFNENARKRSIVIHGADYVSEKYIKLYGRLGRSFGCPALPSEDNARIINLIRDGSVVFCYYPDDHYLRNSKILAGVFKETLASPSF